MLDKTKNIPTLPTDFSHERTITDTLSLSVIVYFDYSLPFTDFSTTMRWKEIGGRQTRRAREKKLKIGSIFTDRRCQNSFASLALGLLLDHASRSLANDTQLQLESQRC